jgi:hypothetical protein
VKVYDDPHSIAAVRKRDGGEPAQRDAKNQQTWRIIEGELYQDLSRYYGLDRGVLTRPKLSCKCKDGRIVNALAIFCLPAFLSVLEDLKY